jgi:hypothetical protein
MKDYAQKALNVLIEQVNAKKMITSFSNIIGDNLEVCRRRNENQDNGAFDPHLFEAYTPEVTVDEFYPETVYRSSEEVVEFLQDCPNCLAAHHAVQDRKKWKKKLATLRGMATKIGMNASAKAIDAAINGVKA